MAKIRTFYGQSLADISLKNYGNIENIVKIFRDNETEIGSLNNFIFENEELNIDETVSENNFTVQQLKDRRLEISTGHLDLEYFRAFSSGFSLGFR